MSTINDRIDAFITKFELQDTPEFREGLGDFVSGCWSDHFKLCLSDTIPEKSTAGKIAKTDKIEDPSECKDINDLRNCTSAVLDEFCKKQGLRVGGTKKDKMERVWRFLQGNNSEEDMSPRGKPKKEKKVVEKHSCYGCTSKGAPCAAAATVEVDGEWFCWRHEESANDIIASKKGPAKKPEAEVVKKPAKKSAKKAESEDEIEEVKPVKKSKKPVKKVESEPESENEELVETDEE